MLFSQVLTLSVSFVGYLNLWGRKNHMLVCFPIDDSVPYILGLCSLVEMRKRLQSAFEYLAEQGQQTAIVHKWMQSLE